MAQRGKRLLEAEQLYEYAVKTLAGRAHSSGELREKLRRKAARAGDVEPVLAQLRERGYLDDRRFAESYAAARLENQRFGPHRVLRDLRGRRVAPSVAGRAVEKLYAGVDEDALVEEYVRRKYRAEARESLFQDEKSLAAAYRRLRRAGFAAGVILRTLRRFAADPELLDRFEPPAEEEEHQL